MMPHDACWLQHCLLLSATNELVNVDGMETLLPFPLKSLPPSPSISSHYLSLIDIISYAVFFLSSPLAFSNKRLLVNN